MIAVGIDLGTTNSCVGWWSKGQVHIIPNEYGNRTTPSYVSFNGCERIIGEAAKNYSYDNNPSQIIIYESKRFMGRTFSDPYVQSVRGKMPYQVFDMGDDKPYFHIPPVRFYHPEEIGAMILVKMKEIAEKHIGQPVKKAVITVPAYFNDAQRQATRDAGHIAGLEVLRIINEPTAAAIAYGLYQKTQQQEKNVLVFDLGGGTLDTSLLTITPDGVFEVRAISGDTSLGGADFDNRLIEHVSKINNTTNTNNDDEKIRKLRSLCEDAKCRLSTENSITITHEDSVVEITRQQFEQMCEDLFVRCMECVKRTLHDANMFPNQIHDVVLVGGSTRMPRIRELLSNFFAHPLTREPRELCTSIDPDEAVAFGAAIQAAMLNYDDMTDNISDNDMTDNISDNISDNNNLPDYVLLDVNPLSLGIETTGQVMNVLIPRNTTIPIAKTKMFSTIEDNQTSVTISIYEGERTITQHNRLLGEFELTGLKPMPRGEAQIEVTFEIDADGIFTVRASDHTNNANCQTLQIKTSKHSTDHIDQMLLNAKQYEEEDKKHKEFIRAKTQYTNMVYNTKKLLSVTTDNTNISILEKLLNDEAELLKTSELPKTAEEYIKRIDRITDVLRPILNDNND